MGKPSAPKPADPAQTAAAQTGMNINTGIANQTMSMVNQKGPNGSLTYNQTGSKTITDPTTGKTYQVPQYTATTGLSPALQQANNANNRTTRTLARTGENVAGQLQDHFKQELSLNGAPRGGQASNINMASLGRVGNGPQLAGDVAQGDITNSYSGDFAAQRNEVQDALLARMNPSLEQDKGTLEARLASQGIGIGSAAYEAAMGDYGRQTNDARMTAILGAGDEQARLVGMERDRAMFQNSAQGQQFGQDLQQVALKNAASQGMYDNKVGAQSFNNNVQQQRMNNSLTREQYRDTARANSIQEMLMMRNQPINEISALMSGSQVSSPNFVNTPGANVANTDYAGLVANKDATLNAQYQTKLGGWNDIMGGLMGGIGTYIGGR